jgi:hypothetical protein
MQYKLTPEGKVPFSAEEQIQWEKDIVEVAVQVRSTRAKEARATRNMLLAECDWIELPSCKLPENKKQEWANYRQTLRDVPLQLGFPENIQWPVKPE